MTIDPNYELASSNELDLDDDEAANDFYNDFSAFEMNTNPNEMKSSRKNNKRNFQAKRKIEQLQEARRMKKLEDDYYDDWD